MLFDMQMYLNINNITDALENIGASSPCHFAPITFKKKSIFAWDGERVAFPEHT